MKDFIHIIEPKLFVYLKKYGYSKADFYKDFLASLSVAIVALPLSLAIAIASNLPPERGLFTAIIAGFLISFFGGSRLQIGGPTAAFIVTVSLVAMKHGYDGLVMATIMSGVILILMAFARAGELIKFIPYPVITGFTSGIALLIVFSQLRDFFGLPIEVMPPDFIDKLVLYSTNLYQLNIYALLVSLGGIFILLYMKKNYPIIPAPIVAIVIMTFAVFMFDLPVDTIESRFGEIPSMLPSPTLPEFSFDKMRLVFPDAITIAILAGIESLLSAVVADGMAGTKHKPNTELFAQGIANIGSSLFGGLPATGAIARTATNVKSGGISPISGIFHAVWLLLFMLLLSPLIMKIPLAVLSAILIVVAWNMAEIKHIKAIIKTPKGDIFVLFITFVLTVLVDLNFAIQAGISLASILFINSMMKSVRIKSYNEYEETDDPDSILKKEVPLGVSVYEVQGPLFFGIVENFIDTFTNKEDTTKVFILRLRYVPLIDAAGLHAIEVVYDKLKEKDSHLILSGVTKKVDKYLHKTNLNTKIGEANIVDHIDKALLRAVELKNLSTI
ncbi:MAG: SulP family inorganic anion transporter [Arcobacteraceae bacterium]|nr:SulP family inorganic anion transporter [Arcobacteraceae bacterium]